MTRTLHAARRGRGARARRLARRADRVPEIAYDANADLLKLPDNIHLGEVGRRRDQFEGPHLRLHAHRRTRTRRSATSRTFYTAARGCSSSIRPASSCARSAQGVYGFNFAQAVRVDPQDNIWVVDRGLEPGHQVRSRRPRPAGARPQAGSIACVPARRRGAGAAADGRGGPPPEGRGAGAPRRRRAARGRGGRRRRPRRRPGRRAPASPATASTDRGRRVGRAGNIYVADGIDGTATRVAKFDKDGHFIKSWGSARHRARAVQRAARHRDRRAGQRLRRRRRQQAHPGVRRRRQRSSRRFTNIGTPPAICITPGAHQYLYSSNSNDAETHGQRRDLQGGARRQDRRQVRPRRQAAEGVRHGQLDRLPQRERAAGRRAEQLARAEGHAEAGQVGRVGRAGQAGRVGQVGRGGAGRLRQRRRACVC